jgi:predicted GNAT family acetyltransferase
MDPLSRPAWHALRGRQADFCIGNDRAVRMAEHFGPFGAAADGSTENLNALAALLPPKGEIWLVESDPVDLPPKFAIIREALCVQMVAPEITPSSSHFEISPLTQADAPEMQTLAKLTEPGPFHARTNELGRFVGIKIDGKLAAMAGERLRPPGHVEVSGVCTYPEFRGRGYAAALMRHVAQRIVDDGEIPFLHAYASNTGAIALYESLGFRTHRMIKAIVVG